MTEYPFPSRRICAAGNCHLAVTATAKVPGFQNTLFQRAMSAVKMEMDEPPPRPGLLSLSGTALSSTASETSHCVDRSCRETCLALQDVVLTGLYRFFLYPYALDELLVDIFCLVPAPQEFSETCKRIYTISTDPWTRSRYFLQSGKASSSSILTALLVTNDLSTSAECVLLDSLQGATLDSSMH